MQVASVPSQSLCSIIIEWSSLFSYSCAILPLRITACCHMRPHRGLLSLQNPRRDLLLFSASYVWPGFVTNLYLSPSS